MKKYFRFSIFFLVLSSIAVVGLGCAVLLCDKVDLHVWMNSCHTPLQDILWSHYTIVGEWIPYVIVGLLLFYKAGWASFLLADILLSGAIGQVLKHVVKADRPLTYFAQYAPDVQLPLVAGVPMNQYLSFPSGHTITFFALFMTLAVIGCEALHRSTKSSTTAHQPLPTLLIQFSAFILALAGGYSRIYLSQHFTEDIVGGIIIGIATTIGLLYVIPKLSQTKFWNWTIGLGLKI